MKQWLILTEHQNTTGAIQIPSNSRGGEHQRKNGTKYYQEILPIQTNNILIVYQSTATTATAATATPTPTTPFIVIQFSFT